MRADQSGSEWVGAKIAMSHGVAYHRVNIGYRELSAKLVPDLLKSGFLQR